MEDKLSREEVLHVAYLARVGLSEEDIQKYQIQLKKLLDDIEKIKEIKNYDDEILITPIDHKSTLRSDVVKDVISNKEVMKNAPSSTGNFVEVPVMLNE